MYTTNRRRPHVSTRNEQPLSDATIADCETCAIDCEAVVAGMS